MKTVYCPVIDGQIDGTTCMEIVDVADGLISKGILEDYDPAIPWSEEQRQKCLNCKWHADLETAD